MFCTSYLKSIYYRIKKYLNNKRYQKIVEYKEEDYYYIDRHPIYFGKL
jgi:two-component SAPR family response regulator